jgi:TldD protein
MTDIARLEKLFFADAGMERRRVESMVSDALAGADDGELFLELGLSEALVFDDGKLKSASFNRAQGFGLRAVAGETTGYAHAAELSEEAIRRAGKTVKAVSGGHGGTVAAPPPGTNRALYADLNPLETLPFEKKVALLAEIDAYVRAKDKRVRQVSASLAGEWRAIGILRADGRFAGDIRPLVRVNVSVVVEENGRMETGSDGAGGRAGYEAFVAPGAWRAQADEALRQALTNLASVPAPAGETVVVLGPGWPGVLLHEAVGHGLEGDFNRKKTSAFAGLMGQRVAARGVTVVDDGTMPDRRGSLTVDDEGTPSGRTVLIEDGILVGYLQDRLNARLMGMKPTGNGRRESFAHAPMPRMTNTFMLAGGHAPDEVLGSVKKGVYAKTFGGGQVDITSGKFTFSCTEAYKIENGALGAPIKGATLIGSGPESLKKISMIGNDLALDRGVGTCGKDGQGVPVGVGLPTLRLDGMTVGGTEAR